MFFSFALIINNSRIIIISIRSSFFIFDFIAELYYRRPFNLKQFFFWLSTQMSSGKSKKKFDTCLCVVRYISSVERCVWVLQKVAIFFFSLTSATTSTVTKIEISLFGFKFRLGSCELGFSTNPFCQFCCNCHKCVLRPESHRFSEQKNAPHCDFLRFLPITIVHILFDQRSHLHFAIKRELIFVDRVLNIIMAI